MEIRGIIRRVELGEIVSDEEYVFLIRAGYSVHENKVYKTRREFKIYDDGTVEG